MLFNSQSSLPTLVILLLATAGLAGAQGAAPPPVDLEVVVVPNPKDSAQPATARPITDLETIPDDFWAHGAWGDILLKNDFAGFVFGAVPEKKEDYKPVRQGSILDIFTSPAAPETFQFIRPTTSTAGDLNSAIATAIDYVEDSKTGSATVSVLGEDQTNPKLNVDTNYEMQKDWPGVLATTTVTNRTREPLKVDIFADFVRWGAMDAFVPSVGWAPAGTDVGNAEFVMGQYYDSFIMVAAVNGTMRVQTTPDAALLTFASNVELKAGESREYKRWILVGQKDPGKLFSFVVSRKPQAQWGYIAGRVQEAVAQADGSGKFNLQSMIPNAMVGIKVLQRPDLGEGYLLKQYMFTVTDSEGNYQIALPEGEYTADALSPSRNYSPQNIGVRVRGNRVTAVDHAMSESSAIAYEIVDADTGLPLPGKISILPLRGGEAVDLGAPGSLAAQNTAWSATGKGIIEVPRGRYRVVASHGTEYNMLELRLDLNKLTTEQLKFELKRAYSAKGWVSADLGVLTDRSPQSRISLEDRVVSAVAEGLDWIVTADSGKPTDLQPTIRNLGLEGRIRASQGLRVTTTKDRPVGDYLLFPLESDAKSSAFDWATLDVGKTPADAMKALRAAAPNAILMAQRPLWPERGVLALAGYGPNGAKPTGDFAFDVDAVQVWEGKQQSMIDPSTFVSLAMYAKGKQPALLGNSASLGTWNEEPGYPRVYIPSKESDPRKLDVAALTAALKSGQAQITNGPFIELTINKEAGGKIITDRDGNVDVELKVQSPNWATVSSITVLVNGSMVKRIDQPAGAQDSGSVIYPTSVSADQGRFRLPVSVDSIVMVKVEGSETIPQDPVNPLVVPTSESRVQQGQRSYAISPLFLIDADGDGKVLPPIESSTPPVSTTPEY